MSIIVNGGINQNFQAANANDMGNATINQVIGNKLDKSLAGPGLASLYDISAYMLYYHVHSPSLVYPRDAAPVTVTAGTGAYTEGTIVEVIPAETKSEAFDIHFVILGTISEVDDYVLKLYTGAAESEVFWAECSFVRDSNQIRGSQVPVQGNPISAGTRISASLMSGIGSNTVQIKLFTHEYPA